MYVLELAGEDDEFAAAEAGNAARDVTVVSPGVVTAATIDETALRHLAFTRRAASLLATTTASIQAAQDALRNASTDRSGTVAVRARDVRGTAGVDTQAAEAVLGSVLTEAGFSIDLEDPENELVAIFSDDICLLGWTVVESIRDYGTRAPMDRPFFQPGSMGPLSARAVVNLAGVRSGDVVLDPMCGTGGLLIEAGLIGARLLGFDAQRRMVRGTRHNLAEFVDTPFLLGVSDATALPVVLDGVDAVAFDTPYGRQSKIATHDLDVLVRGALAETKRVADRGVVVADREVTDVAESAGWSVRSVYERRVHRSLTRYVHVLR
ncbi:MAG: TIGR01177 family methyltransferase [Halodesulfurarchaeum sp.]